MDSSLLSGLLREGLLVVGAVGWPMFAALLVVGAVVGVLQAATQVNDPAVGFLPRLLAAIAVAWLLGPWMVGRLAGFLTSALERAAQHPF